MPDASLMLELCEILDITVNELLSGERIAMEDYKKKAEDIVLKNKGNQNAGSPQNHIYIKRWKGTANSSTNL